MTDAVREFAEDVKNLAALADDFEPITPWTPVSQVVAMACGRLDELKATEGLTEEESNLARTADGAIHAVCIVLDQLEESWYERHNEAVDIDQCSRPGCPRAEGHNQ